MREYGHEYADFHYYTPTPFERLGGVWLIRSGRTSAKSNYAVGTRMIECYSLHFVLNGSVELLWEGGSAMLRKGDLFALYPGKKHSYRVCDYMPSSPLAMHWAAFDGPQAQQVLERVGLAPERPYVQGGVSGGLIEHLRGDFHRHAGEGQEFGRQAALYRLFSLLDLPPERAAGNEPRWLATCEEYIRHHCMESIRISDIARMAGVHRSHLYAEFSRRYGMSPQAYLLDRRMDKAAELLAADDLSVTEVSLSLGYSDLYAFSRAFCRHYGISPTAFRLQRGQDQVAGG